MYMIHFNKLGKFKIIKWHKSPQYAFIMPQFYLKNKDKILFNILFKILIKILFKIPLRKSIYLYILV